MNTAQIKAYAPKARRDFIQAVTEKANQVGLSAEHIESVEIKGDVAIIAGRPFPKKVGELQKKLAERIQKDGFDQVMEAAAYTWFNRFAALRYMEIHNYLGHGFRVLSSRGNSNVPEILEESANIDLPGLDKKKVMELRLAGDKDNELYNMLIIAQCSALHRSMPFLFENIDSETELLIPDNLLHSNSPVRKLVEEIDEEQWNKVEIIGWIYQFYISEKKDQVIGKVVKSEDIPAATQLFTPNWIVKYMVQNTLARMWLATYPDSPLKDKMEYYIEPAEQEPEVRNQLDAITPKELNPKEITFLDPASGSGHILVEAYDVLKGIYLERGYRTRDIPRLILEKNLYGLDIDDRAAQLACFAVLMKARKDDRRILSRDDLKLNIMAIQETSSFDAEALTKNLLKEKVIRFAGENELFPDFKGQMALRAVKRYEVSRDDVIELLELFQHGKTFGSLITIPDELAEKLPLFTRLIDDKLQHGDMFERTAASKFKPVVEMAMVLARKYDCVVANPPYMGNKYLNSELKNYLKTNFKGYEKDLFSAFIIRNRGFSETEGQLGFMSPFVWMFISSYENLRKSLIGKATLTTLIQLEYSGFAGATVPICTFTFQNYHCDKYAGSFIRLSDFRGAENQAPKTLEAIRKPECAWRYTAKPDDFKKIPGSPIAYWVSKVFLTNFERGISLGEFAEVKRGMTTSDNNTFLRFWPEVSFNKSFRTAKSDKDALASRAKWFPYSKGGGYRKWFGFLEFFINWKDSGRDVIDFAKTINNSYTRTIVNIQYYFLPSVSFSYITSGPFSMRWLPEGCLYDSGGPGVFCSEKKRRFILGCLNSSPSMIALKLLNPTLNLQIADVVRLPLPEEYQALKGNSFFGKGVNSLVSLAKNDWNSYETSWDFAILPLLNSYYQQTTLETTYMQTRTHWRKMTLEMHHLEEENNRIFIEAYGLQDELTPEVPLSEVTLTCNPHYRYNGNKSEDELETLLLDDTIKELISYAIGCMMGRYRLDHPGLIYANSGNENFWEIYNHKTNKHSDNSSLRCGEFQPDDDGIIPIMDQNWFPDDATSRFVEFLKVAWPPEHLDENLKFVADSLKPKNNEAPVDTIRRYLSAGFFKDHLKTYKKRPIYWLFSSGKQKAFECLVYLHRYNETTLPRMRSNYVTPLQGKFNARLDYLRTERDAGGDKVSAKKKIQKEIDALKKKQAELTAFDIELRHYADMKISLDLDDGVKVNYGKFGDLLAEKKAVTGKK
jgi:type II restriction/modification system DNA methylase subunit YeeA